MEPPWPVYAKRADVDPLAVDHAVAGLIPAGRLTTAERIKAVRRFVAAGMTDVQIAQRTRWCSANAVTQFRLRWGIPAGKPKPRKRAA